MNEIDLGTSRKRRDMPAGSSGDVDPVREVNRLHLMLEDWYGGIREDIDPIEDALAAEFTSIGRDGVLRDRRASLRVWREDRNAYRESTPPVSVDLEDVTVQRTIYGVHQVTYRKRLRVDGEWETYGCSLWLRETERVATGLQWLHLAETPVIESDEDGEEASENL